MKLIELGEIDYKILIPLIYPILYQVRGLIHKDDEKALFLFFTNFCGYLLSGIVYLIIKWRTRRLKSDKLEKIDKIKDNKGEFKEKILVENTSKKISAYKIGDNQIIVETKKVDYLKLRSKYLFILLLVCIYLIPMFFDSYTASKEELNFGTSSSLSLFFCIFFIIAFSRILLGHKIYSHQIFSSIIIVISILIVLILIFLHDDFSNYTFYNIIIIIIITGFYALFNVLEKRYFNIYMGSPYNLMFFIGAFSLILILLYEIIIVFSFGIDCDYCGIFYQFKKNIENYGFLYILIFLGDTITAFIWVSGIQLTVYFFTPCHFIISESISQIISTIIKKAIKDFPVIEKVIIYFLFCLIILATLIYNEVIIINVCHLNKDTKKLILIRQLSETEDIIKQRIMDSVLDDNDDDNDNVMNKFPSRDSSFD